MALLDAANDVAQGSVQRAAVRRAKSLSAISLNVSPTDTARGIAEALCPHVVNLMSIKQRGDQKSMKAYIESQLQAPLPETGSADTRALCTTMIAVVSSAIAQMDKAAMWEQVELVLQAYEHAAAALRIAQT